MEPLIRISRQIAKLAWIEIKIFLREPMGAVGTIAMPVLFFLVFGKLAWGTDMNDLSPDITSFVKSVPVPKTVKLPLATLTVPVTSLLDGVKPVSGVWLRAETPVTSLMSKI